MYTYDTVDICQSLVKAEWNIVRTYQNMVDSLIGDRTNFQNCGLLFFKEYAFATNGHWIMRIKTEKAFLTTPVYYDYNIEDVVEDYAGFPIDLQTMFDLVSAWKPYTLKVRVADIMGVLDEAYPVLKDKRLYGVTFHTADNMITLDLTSKKYAGKTKIVPTYKECSYFPDICIQMSYLYKMLEITAPYYHVVEFCVGDSGPVTIKAKNPFQHKPDIRFVVGQYLPVQV